MSRSRLRGHRVALAILCLLSAGTGVADPVLSSERMLALQHLLKQDCGSCHGMTLRGGLGPSLLPQDLSTRSVTALTQKILWGVPQRGMPAWQPLLSEAEAAWLAEQLVNGASATP